MLKKQYKFSHLFISIMTLLVIVAGALWFFRNQTSLHKSQPGPAEIGTTLVVEPSITTTSIVVSSLEGTLSVTPTIQPTPFVTRNQNSPVPVTPTIQPIREKTKTSPSINAVQSRFFIMVSDEYTKSFELKTPLPQNGQRFPGSVDEAEVLAGFKIMEPTFLPDGYVLRTIDYSSEDQHVGLLYYKPSDGLSPQLYFMQQLKAFSEHQSIIGTSAIIQESQVNDVAAEYVQGGFDDAGSTSNADHLRWNPYRDLGRFRWVKDNYYFQISTGTVIDAATLRYMAESLKQHSSTPNATPLPILGFEETPSN